MRTLIAFALVIVPFARATFAQTQLSEEQRIKQLIAEQARASERRDLRGLVDLYHADAEWILSNGTRLAGRAAIEDAYRQSIESPVAKSGRHHIHPDQSVRIRFLRPDFALVEVESHSVGGTDAQGAPLPTSKSLLITLWTKQDGEWTILYQRGTPVQP
jgi:uncharacterized protein (TIGR02246 family)